MNTINSVTRIILAQVGQARAWALMALAVFAAPHLALAGPFSAVSVSPPAQTVAVGDTFTVDINFQVGDTTYGATSGMETRVGFDPAVLQVVSVSTGGSSPYTTLIPGFGGVDNVGGVLSYGARGPGLGGGSFVAAQIEFVAVGAGESNLRVYTAREYFPNNTPWGIDGGSVGGAVTVTGTLPTQTLTILGGSGNPGETSINVEYYNPVTAEWQPAFMADYAPYGHPGGHPWGKIAGTSGWVNHRADGASVQDNVLLQFLYRIRFTAPASYNNPTMVFSLKADNFAQVAINGINAGGLITGSTDQQNADAVFTQSLVSGENEITIDVGDSGGLNGFNFRIDLTVDSEEPLEEIEPEPADTTAPVIIVPADITAEATSAAGATVSYSATATDETDGSVSVIAVPPSGSVFELGSTVVGLAAADAAGNTADATFLVLVQDTIAPNLTVPGGSTTEATSAAGAAVSYAEATASDVVGVNSITYSAASGSIFALGTTSVTVEADDAAGNSSSGSFDLTVEDTTAPVLSAPGNVSAEATSASGAAVTYPDATATDAVGVTSITYSAASGSIFALGTTAVSVGASDAAANASSGSFDVTVEDTTAPEITSVAPSITTIWPPNKKMIPVSVTVDAADAVGVVSTQIVSVSSNQTDRRTQWDITGPLTVNLLANRNGKEGARIYTITVEVTDGAGNTTTATCVVTVPHDQRKSVKSGKSDKSDKSDKSKKSGKSAKSAKSDKSDKSDKSGKKGKGRK